MRSRPNENSEKSSETANCEADLGDTASLGANRMNKDAVSPRLPFAILDWIEKANAEANMQIRAYSLGVQSKAEFQKQKNENAKLAAAKKPWPKKATKEKST